MFRDEEIGGGIEYSDKKCERCGNSIESDSPGFMENLCAYCDNQEAKDQRDQEKSCKELQKETCINVYKHPDDV
jgi:hypothetical protein